jgi:hypothetical protein
MAIWRIAGWPGYVMVDEGIVKPAAGSEKD